MDLSSRAKTAAVPQARHRAPTRLPLPRPPGLRQDFDQHGDRRHLGSAHAPRVARRTAPHRLAQHGDGRVALPCAGGRRRRNRKHSRSFETNSKPRESEKSTQARPSVRKQTFSGSVLPALRSVCPAAVAAAIPSCPRPRAPPEHCGERHHEHCGAGAPRPLPGGGAPS